jgi:hypothetical protein
LFSHFAEAIKLLPETGPDDVGSFVLEDLPKVQIVYAPFDWVNRAARVVVVGITPGTHSMLAAFGAARAALQAGKTLEESARLAKQTGSFSNMRSLIAAMLDELEVHKVLGIETTLHLFGGRDAGLLHATSCVRYPVLYKHQAKQNYTGHSPPLMKYAPFVAYVDSMLASELQSVPEALIVPCGKAASQALEHLGAKGKLDLRRCLMGFPHASGANGHRKREFEERREQLRLTVMAWAQTKANP